MALNVQDMPIEVAQGDLVTRYVELGDMAIRMPRCLPGPT
jgi:hypothetical protein